MATPGRYAKIAEELEAKIPQKGFRRFSYAEIQKAVRQAGDTDSPPAQRRDDLERELRSSQGVHAYPPLKTGNVKRGTRYYRLYRYDSAVAKLVDIIVNPGKDNDQKLKKLVSAVNGVKRLKGLMD